MTNVCGLTTVKGITALRNSCNFLHVEVELQTDGHIQRDTCLLEKYIEKSHKRDLMATSESVLVSSLN